MTDAERLKAIGQRGRICGSCGGLIVQWRPVFLVGDTDGKIMGPYHASCAEKIALARRRSAGKLDVGGRVMGRIVPKGGKES